MAIVAPGVLGLVVAGALDLRAVARSATLRRMPLHPDLPGEHTSEERALLDEHIMAYRIDGPLLFAAHRFLLELAEIAHVSVVILRMSAVSASDAVLHEVRMRRRSHAPSRPCEQALSRATTPQP